MTFTADNQSQCWGDSPDYYLTNEFNHATYHPSQNNDPLYAGFNFVTSIDNGYPAIAYGLYKISNNLNNTYFYVDYRDQRAGFYSLLPPVPIGHSIDVWFKFDANNNFFEYSNDPNDYDYNQINKGDVLKIWDIKGKGIPQTHLFPGFWSNALAVVNNGSGNPKLVWSAYPSSNLVVKKYRVYRAVTQNTYPPPTPNFSLLKDNISPSTFEYTDLNYALGGNLRLYYKITAMVEDPELEIITETSASNIKEVGGGFYKTGNASKITETIHFLNNYPNPFNPKTNISFHLTKNTHVILNVYNVLGNLVSKLIDENKSEGIHQISFDGSSISSGVYLLVLMAEGKIISKKMLLSK